MMKRNAIVALAIAIAVSITLAAAWKASGGTPGSGIISAVNTARFMLFGGTYTVQPNQTESGIFKIDSYTGDTWILKVETVNGKHSGRWIEIQSPAPAPSAEASAQRLPGE